MENWDKPFARVFRDWSRRRDEIKPLFYAAAGVNLANYANLTQEQKIIGAKYFFTPKTMRRAPGMFTPEEDIANWRYLATETKRSRLACTEEMRKCVSNCIPEETLTLAQTQQFQEDVLSYITLFEGSNSPKLKLWIISGTGFEATGFESKTYYNEALRDALIEIYNGAY